MRPQVFGNYTLLDRIGKGGMAEVFLAKAHSTVGFEKLIAIKRLLSAFNSDKQIISMLADEARLSVWLNHPNIVQVLDFGRVGRTYYIAMEFVDGCDLCDLVRPAGQHPGNPLPLSTALYVMMHIADALDYAHNRRNRNGERLGVIHRDVSPHNILISREGQLKLADFGLARASISVHLSATGVIRGKFSYMPKEQAKGRDFDHRIDIFAAGCTLYETLTGVKPYTSTTLAQQIYQLEQIIPPPSAHVASIPAEVDRITMRAMCPEPGGRYASAEELGRELRHVLGRVSTTGNEAGRLAALVCATVGSSPHFENALPPPILDEFSVSGESLIGDAIAEVQREQQLAPAARAGSDSLLAATPPPLVITDERDTDRAPDHEGAAPGSASEVEDVVGYREEEASEDGVRTMFAPGRSEPPRGARPPSGDQPLVTPRWGADGRSDPLGRTDPYAMGETPPPAVLPPAEADHLEVEEDTIDERARRQRSTPDTLDEARTVQRSPEEVLAAYQRALVDRAARPPQEAPASPASPETAPRPASAAPTKTTAVRRQLGGRAVAVLVAAGLILFAVGLWAGMCVRAPEPILAPPISIKMLPPVPEMPIVEELPPSSPLDASPQARDQLAVDAAPPETGGAPRTITDHPDAAAADPEPRARPSRRPAHGGEGARPGGRRTRPAPAGSGFLTVSSNAPARLFIDDQAITSNLPVNSLPLDPGIHRVKIYSTQTKTFSDTQWVTIRPGRTVRLTFVVE